MSNPLPVKRIHNKNNFRNHFIRGYKEIVLTHKTVLRILNFPIWSLSSSFKMPFGACMKMFKKVIKNLFLKIVTLHSFMCSSTKVHFHPFLVILKISWYISLSFYRFYVICTLILELRYDSIEHALFYFLYDYDQK